jgi:hypothetical protein
MITTGIQDQLFAEKHFDPSHGTRSVELKPVKEKFLLITLPYRRTIYCINEDAPLKKWLKFGIWWHKHPIQKCWYVRLGWIN